MTSSPPARGVAWVAVAGFLAALGACSAGADDASDGRVEVLASFYPLQYVAERVGGNDVVVSSLTPPAAEPHDLELSPGQVRSIGEVDLVVYLSEFQNATDEAVAARAPEHVVDAIAATDRASADPHFWLDPTRLAAVAQDVADELALVDPDNALAYQERADALAADLTTLDGEYAATLARCEGATLVTSHEAFGYLADRYGLLQEGISGIDPDAEPSPARLREVRSIVEAADVSTLFFEVLVSPKVTQTLADDLGVTTAVLDPLEGHVDEQVDYLEVMRANLVALDAGLTCG